MYSNLYNIETSKTLVEKIKVMGISVLSDQELAEVFVGGGVVNSSFQSLAKDILNECEKSPGTFPSFESLLQISGIGEAQVFQLIASFELARRFYWPRKGYFISDPIDIYHLVKLYAYSSQKKNFVVTLSGSQEFINCTEVSLGSVRQIFSEAFHDSAASIIIIHNHPNGSLAPSTQDIQFTEYVSQSGQLLGIPLIDHLIVSREGYYSFRENKLLED